MLTFARLQEPLPPVPAPQLLPPMLLLLPSEPGEGTLVTVLIEPRGRGLPLLEARGLSAGGELEFARLPGGAYLALVAAPLGAEDVPIELTVTVIDGTRLQRELDLSVAARDFPATRLRVANRFTAPDAATLKRIQRERTTVRAVLRTATDQPLWRGPFELPLNGVTTSPYGQRRLFNNELRSRHTGHDIDGDTGDPVSASNSGRVVISRDLFFNGGAVFIDHGLGLYTGYFHLSRRDVAEGQWVEKGEQVGLVGATGRVTGPHLHWSVYLNGITRQDGDQRSRGVEVDVTLQPVGGWSLQGTYAFTDAILTRFADGFGGLFDPLSIFNPEFMEATNRLEGRPVDTDFTTNP